jgi:hypothetical protein
MHDLPAFTEEDEEAIAEAQKLLQPLTTARRWSVVNWNDPDASNDPRDEFEAAVEFVIALLDPALPESSDQLKTYDGGVQRRAADELLGDLAPIVRKVVLPALRLGRLPKRKGQRSLLVRHRWIAVVVETICQRYGRDPQRNPLSKHRHNGCAIIAEALKRLGVGLDEETVKTIYLNHRPRP